MPKYIVLLGAFLLGDYLITTFGKGESRDFLLEIHIGHHIAFDVQTTSNLRPIYSTVIEY